MPATFAPGKHQDATLVGLSESDIVQARTHLIYNQKKAALKRGGDALMHPCRRGGVIMSILGEFGPLSLVQSPGRSPGVSETC